MRLPNKKSAILSTALAIGLCAAAFAEEASNAPPGYQLIEEVVVTAQKREQNSQDIAVAVAAYSGDQLRALGVTRADEIANFTPGVQINDFSGSTPTFVIRGIGIQDTRANTAPAAAVHLDGIYLVSNMNTGPQIFDVERVEILKGPQGTLFGRNNSAGTVNIITAKPTAQQEGFLFAEYGNFDRLLLEGAYSGPVSDAVSIRLSARREASDGFFDNVQFPPGPGAGALDPISGVPLHGNIAPVRDDGSPADSDLGDLNRYALRGQLQWDMDDRTSVLFNVHFADDSSDLWPGMFVGTSPAVNGTFGGPSCVGSATPTPDQCFSGSGASDPDPFDNDVSNNLDGQMDSQFFGGFVEVQRETDWGQLTSITGYEGFDVDFWRDEGVPTKVFETRILTESDQITQEIRLTNDSNLDWVWVAGAYFSWDEIKANQLFEVDPNGVAFDGTYPFCDGGFQALSGAFLGPLFGLAPGRDFVLDPNCAYTHPALDPNIGTPAQTFNPALTNIYQGDTRQETLSAALFMHNEIMLSQTVKAVIGARFTYETRDFDGSSNVLHGSSLEDPETYAAITQGVDMGAPLSSPDGNPVAVPDIFSGGLTGTRSPNATRSLNLGASLDQTDFSFRAGLEWTPADNQLWFVTVSRGFKSGGWDGNAVTSGVLYEPYKAERVLQYEAGLKSDWLDNALRFNASAYYSDYDRPQIRANILINGLPNSRLVNAQKADILGAELELNWRTPVPGLEFLATAAFIDSEVQDNNPILLDPTVLDGIEFPYAANKAFTVVGRYSFQPAPGLFAFATLSYAYTGPHHTNIENLRATEQTREDLTARFTLASTNSGWEVSVWGKNLTDDRVIVSDGGDFFEQLFIVTNMPRTYGLALTYNL